MSSSPDPAPAPDSARPDHEPRSGSAPLVSVIVPAYNSARYLAESLHSVLTQTHRELEVIVVDDGSTDDTPEVLAAWAAADTRIRVIRQENRGLPSARNSGLEAMRGEYVAFLDADDVIRPEKLERQLAYLRAHPEADLVYSDHSTADEHLQLLSDDVVGVKQLPTSEVYAYTNLFPVMSPLLRRSLVERVGLFDPVLKSCEDWDYWVRCERVGRFGYLPGHYSVYRMHGSQMHRRLDFMLRYARLAATKNYPDSPERVRSMVGSLLWWQFGLQMRDARVNRFQVLLRPRILFTALRMLWEVRSLRRALYIRRIFRSGI